MNNKFYILIVEDEPSDAKKIKEFVSDSLIQKLKLIDKNLFEKVLFEVIEFGNCDDTINYLNENPSLITSFIDLKIPKSKEIQHKDSAYGVEVLSKISEMEFSPFSFIISDYIDKSIIIIIDELFRSKMAHFNYEEKTQFFKIIDKGGVSTISKAHSQAVQIWHCLLRDPLYYNRLRIRKILGDFEGIDEIALNYTSYEIGSSSSQNNIKPSISTQINGKVNVADEINKIQIVLLHKPGKEVDLVTPQNNKKLLFDQCILYRKFKEQHETFASIIKKSSNNAVYYVEDLLKELLEEQDWGIFLKAKFIYRMIETEKSSPEIFWKLLPLEPKKIIEIAFSGQEDNNKYFSPIPNFVFTRDWGFAIHNLIFVSTMKREPRKREREIARFIFEYHPLFKNSFNPKNVIENEDPDKEKEISIEGGDVILLSEECVLVGISERTSLSGISRLANILFASQNPINKVVATEAPSAHERSMHLDTYLGVLSKKEILVYENPLCRGKNAFIVFERGKDNPYLLYQKIQDFLNDILKTTVKIIKVDSSKEHYEDACNVFALCPSKIVIYQRAEETIAKLGEHGWKRACCKNGKWNLWEWNKAKGWLPDANNQNKDIVNLMKLSDKIAFLFDGSELGLARGGPHCMTCPIWRE